MANKILDNNLLSILKTFSESEWKDFEKFVASPFHNRGRNLVPVLRQLKNFYPGFDSPKLTKEFLYGKLFAGKSYRASVINSSFSRLNIMAEEFLLQLGLKENRYMIREKLLINQLGAKGIKKRAEKLIAETQRRMEAKKEEPFDFTSKKEMAMEIASFYSVNNMRHKHLEYLEKSRKYIIYSFLSEFFFFKSTEVAGYSIKQTEKNPIFEIQIADEINFESIMNIVESDDKENFKFLNLYFLLMKAATHHESSENYFRFKDEAYRLLDEMTESMKRLILNTLGVFSSIYMVSGKSEFRKESFEIKKKTLDENLFAFSSSGNPKISEFRSTFIDALNEKEYEWAENFCKKFIQMISADERDNVRNYFESRLLYEKNDYDNALKLSSLVNLNQITFKLDIKNLQAKIYYDTNSFETLMSLIDSYTKLTGRPGQRTSILQLRHRRFAAYLKKLIMLRERNADAYKLVAFKQKILKDNFTSKTWMIERLDEMIASYQKAGSSH